MRLGSRAAGPAWQKKLRSQSGASILLALLFLVLCVLVGSSVLMAASSNAGKSRSNRQEHQNYLALSSALRLICEELENASYQGNYSLAVAEIPEESEEPDGDPAYRYTFSQQEGTFACELKEVLPLGKELDQISGQTFPEDRQEEHTGNVYEYPDPSETLQFEEHVLTLTATAEDGSPVAGLEETVTVTVQLEQDYSIKLKAVLGSADADGYQYTMYAQMVHTGNPNFSSIPGVKNPPPYDGGNPGLSGSTDSLTWSLGWIAKQEAGAQGL